MCTASILRGERGRRSEREKENRYVNVNYASFFVLDVDDADLPKCLEFLRACVCLCAKART